MVGDGPEPRPVNTNSRARRRAIASRMRTEGIDYRAQYFIEHDRARRADLDNDRIRRREAAKDADLYRLRAERNVLLERIRGRDVIIRELGGSFDALLEIVSAPGPVNFIAIAGVAARAGASRVNLIAPGVVGPPPAPAPPEVLETPPFAPSSPTNPPPDFESPQPSSPHDVTRTFLDLMDRLDTDDGLLELPPSF